MSKLTLLQTRTPAGYESTGAFVGIFFEGAILLIILFLVVDLYRIYRQSKVKMTFDLFIGFVMYWIALFFSWIAKWYLWQHSESALEGPFWLQLIYKFKITMVFAILANYYIIVFFKTIFSETGTRPPINKITIIRKTIFITIIIVSHIPAYLTRSAEIAYTTDAISFLLLLIDMFFLIPNGIKSFKSSRNMDFGRKYFYIGLMAFFAFNMVIMFLIDRITMLLGIPGPFGELGYTVFYFAGWSSVAISVIFAIYGFVRK
jgi:hypothetical protein